MNTHKPGNLWNRWLAYMADNIFLALLVFPVLVIAEILTYGKFTWDVETARLTAENPPLIFLAIIINLYYRIFLLYKYEATPGKKWRKLKVVQYSNGKRINILKAAIRELFKFIYFAPNIGIILNLITIILVLFPKKARSLHDIVSDTYVVDA